MVERRKLKDEKVRLKKIMKSFESSVMYTLMSVKPKIP